VFGVVHHGLTLGLEAGDDERGTGANVRGPHGRA